MSPRLAAGLWVQAYLMRLSAEGIMALVQRKGDATAGAIYVKLCFMDGRAALYGQSYDLMADTRRWECQEEGPEAEIDALLERQAARDRDLWIIAVEDPAGRHLLEDPSLAI
ncbi:MAG: DUF1491 family protein [Mangrovicoccus sp.]|nr:DUF1491 family protein [Mangrovicoccus sp.]